MPFKLPFKQVDVFTSEGFKGNPVAVINCLGINESEVTKDQLQAVANWTNLSETTFIFKPSSDQFDYKLRIFTPKNELPFAGHPTIGSCKAFLEFTNQIGKKDVVYQECGVGRVELTIKGKLISFQGEQTIVEDIADDVAKGYAQTLGVTPIETVKLLKVGPNWVVILVDEAQLCYNSNPDFAKISQISNVNDHTGIILGGKKKGTTNEYEMRAFAPVINVDEDPVCGSGALAFIRYLKDAEKIEATSEIKITQGGRLGRNGQISGIVKVHEDGKYTYHVGGDSLTVIEGQILL
ncbi:hypothetical protein MOUN0_L08878 [Monosporozyma unispora]|nr:hypothetical protein C6P44_003312 [Kazachstania unispora]